jgi:hypothetical protein
MRPHRGLAPFLLSALAAVLPGAAESSSLDRAMISRIIQQRQAEYQKCHITYPVIFDQRAQKQNKPK